MDERILQLRVGIFVLLAIVILLFLVWLNSEVWKTQYTLYIKPTTAPGVTRNTPVRKNGVLIGRVSSVATQDDHVIVKLRIDADESIYSNEVAQVGTDSFLGDAVIEILPLPVDRRGERLTNEQLLPQISIKRNPLEIVDVALNLEDKISDTLSAVSEAGIAVQDAGERVSDIAITIQGGLGEDEGSLKQLFTELRETNIKARSALDNFNTLFENVNNIVEDPENKNRLREFVDELPEILREIRTTVVSSRETIESFRSVSERATTNLDNLEDVTLALKEQGPTIVSNLNDSLKKADGLFSEFEAAAQSLSKIQNSEGTVGKLLNDPQLYNSALETVNNIRDLSRKLEPLVNDLRLFADGLARDPGQLGVRGALNNRQAPNTGYKAPRGRSTTGRW